MTGSPAISRLATREGSRGVGGLESVEPDVPISNEVAGLDV